MGMELNHAFLHGVVTVNCIHRKNVILGLPFPYVSCNSLTVPVSA